MRCRVCGVSCRSLNRSLTLFNGRRCVRVRKYGSRDHNPICNRVRYDTELANNSTIFNKRKRGPNGIRYNSPKPNTKPAHAGTQHTHKQPRCARTGFEDGTGTPEGFRKDVDCRACTVQVPGRDSGGCRLSARCSLAQARVSRNFFRNLGGLVFQRNLAKFGLFPWTAVTSEIFVFRSRRRTDGYMLVVRQPPYRANLG